MSLVGFLLGAFITSSMILSGVGFMLGMMENSDVSAKEMKKNKYKYNIPFRMGRRLVLWYHVWGNKGGDEIKQPDWVLINKLEDENDELKDKIRELEETITELYLTSDTDVRRNKQSTR